MYTLKTCFHFSSVFTTHSRKLAGEPTPQVQHLHHGGVRIESQHTGVYSHSNLKDCLRVDSFLHSASLTTADDSPASAFRVLIRQAGTIISASNTLDSILASLCQKRQVNSHGQRPTRSRKATVTSSLKAASRGRRNVKELSPLVSALPVDKKHSSEVQSTQYPLQITAISANYFLLLYSV